LDNDAHESRSVDGGDVTLAGGAGVTDDLTPLLNSEAWVKRRVDQIEFLDLRTVRRTIVFTLDIKALETPESDVIRIAPELVPLGWFVPWGNAGAVLRDDEQRVIPYLTSEESDTKVEALVKERLKALRVTTENVRQIPVHRADPGAPSLHCKACKKAVCGDKDRAQLVANKWGCREVATLLAELELGGDSDPHRELARILLAWQTNFVLFVRRDSLRPVGDLTTLELSYGESLKEWEPPWEQLQNGLSDGDPWRRASRSCRGHISRGGPFHEDLDLLMPGRVRGLMARSKHRSLRRQGRRGCLGVTWHVVWSLSSGLKAPHHQVDVVLPSELTSVRMRMLRRWKGKRRATVADQVGARPTIVSPQAPAKWHVEEFPPSPTLFSLVLTQSSTESWSGGAFLAGLTGIAILAAAVFALSHVVKHLDAAVTLLLIAPTLVSTVLSVRAGSEIAAELTRTPRRLIATVGVLAAIAAIGLILQRVPAEELPDYVRAPEPDTSALRAVWIAISLLMLCIAAALFVGARQIRSLIAWGRIESSREVSDTEPGLVLNPPTAPPIPPPDRWLDANEGELIPWGWLHDCHLYPSSEQCLTEADRCFWSNGLGRGRVVGWIQKVQGYN
jgi:hypothetical protein